MGVTVPPAVTVQQCVWKPGSRSPADAAQLIKLLVPHSHRPRQPFRVHKNVVSAPATIVAREAVWLMGGAAIAVCCDTTVAVAAGVDTGFTLDDNPTVWVPAGGTATIPIRPHATEQPRPVTVAAAAPNPGCAPIAVYNGRYADALLALPGTNLCVPAAAPPPATWSDAVLVGPGGHLVCTHCGATFPTIAAINDHFPVIKLASPHYTSIAPLIAAGAPTSSPAGSRTPPQSPESKRARLQARRAPREG